MRRIEILAVALFVATAAPAAAQVITMIDHDSARAAFRVGFGGRGIDLDGSIDSPLLAGIFRVGGSVGQGRWVGLGEVPPLRLLDTISFQLYGWAPLSNGIFELGIVR